jgi:hypothetical protein
MPSNDSRFYPRISATSSTTITCPQAVLDQFKPIKTPAVDEETPAVYYVEADGLTIHEAALAAGIPVAYFDESQGGKPVQVETIEEATTVLYVLPPMLPTAMEPFLPWLVLKVPIRTIHSCSPTTAMTHGYKLASFLTNDRANLM